MIIDLVDKLVDRVVQLLKYEKQMRTQVRDTYVAPVFEEFAGRSQSGLGRVFR